MISPRMPENRMLDRIGLTNDIVSCYSSTEVKAKAYQQIWREIDALEVAIRALKTRHNSLNVTARLPDELLGTTFEWNAETLRGAERLPWIKVAFVCSDWRRVTLPQPRLWSCICHVPINLVPALLPLSGAVPLDLDFVAYDSSVERTTQVLLSVMHRIREFRVENPRYPTQIEEILSDMAIPAPLLESLQLSSVPRTRASILPNNLFGGVVPRLQALDLHGWFLSNFHEYGALEATALWHCISTRRVNGATLRALHILKSVGFTQLHCEEQADVTSAIDILREIVTEVHWDVEDKAAAE